MKSTTIYSESQEAKDSMLVAQSGEIRRLRERLSEQIEINNALHAAILQQISYGGPGDDYPTD